MRHGLTPVTTPWKHQPRRYRPLKTTAAGLALLLARPLFPALGIRSPPDLFSPSPLFFSRVRPSGQIFTIPHPVVKRSKLLRKSLLQKKFFLPSFVHSRRRTEVESASRHDAALREARKPSCVLVLRVLESTRRRRLDSSTLRRYRRRRSQRRNAGASTISAARQR